MKRVVKWGSNLVTVILGIFMVVTMFCAVSSRLGGGTPKVLGFNMYEVLSGSMEPGIHTGSVIFDKPNVNTSSLHVGDVITFKAPNQEYGANEMIITHRIHKVVHQNGQVLFETKGDANNAPDPSLVPAANVIAQYDNVTIPDLGFYLSFMKTKLGIGLLLILPGALLIFSTMLSLFREILKIEKSSKGKSTSEASSDANA